MVLEQRSTAIRYSAAVMAAAIATGISLLSPALVAQTPFIFYFAAVAFSAWFGGIGPGILAIVVSILAYDFFLVEPTNAFVFSARDFPKYLTFIVVAFFITSLSNARQRAERRRDEQRELLRITLASIGDAVITTDADRRITFINGIAERLTGWSAAEATGRELREVFRIVDETTRQPADDPLDRVLREGAVVGLPSLTLLIAKDGREVPIDDSAAPIRTANKEIVGSVLVFRDVTERRGSEHERARLFEEAETARRQAEHANRRFQFLAEASEVLASSLDYRTTLRSVAQLAVPHIGDWSAIDIVDDSGEIQRLAVAHIDPAKVEWAHELEQQYPRDPNAPTGVPNVIRTGKPEFYPHISDEMLVATAKDENHLRLMREIGFSSAMIVPIMARDRTLGVITLVASESGMRYEQADLDLAMDLARRAGVAIDNARLYSEARDQREWLRVTLSSIGDAVIATDDTGHVSFMNPIAESLTGWSGDDARGRALDEVFDIVNETTRLPVESPVTKVLREGTIVGLANHTVLLARDGRETPIDDSGAPIRDESGRLIGVVLTFHDISERRRSEEELTRSRDQLDVILKGVTDGITAQSTDGSLIYANDAAALLTGYPDAESLVKSPLREVMSKFEIFDEHGEPIPVTSLPSRHALRGEIPTPLIVMFRIIETGEERWSVVNARPVFDDQGTVLFAINIFHDVTELKRNEQNVRIRAQQHAVVADLGQKALSGMELSELMNETCRVLNQTLHIELCKVLELLPDGKALLIRAGTGWRENLVGRQLIEVDRTTQAGYTLLSEEPVLTEDLTQETRFIGSPVLHEHHVVSSMTVVIPGPDRPFGVLGAHSPRRRVFSEDDIAFLRSLANVLAAAIQRKKFEELLHEQREWLQVTLSSIGDAVIATDTHGDVTFMNSVAESMTGWTQAEAHGVALSTVFDIINEDTRQPVESPVVKVLRDGVTVGLANHTVLVARDGSEKPIDDSAAPIRDHDGSILGVVLVFHDISDRKKAQDALRISENRFRTVIEQSPLSMQIFAPNGDSLQANQAWERLWDTSVSALHDYNILRDQQLEAKGVMPYIRRAFEGEPSATPPTKYDPAEIGKTGRPRWVRAVVYPVKDDHDHVREVVLVLDDVTERINAENALRESEARFRAMADNAPVLIWESDTAGLATYFNKPWLDFTGRTTQQEFGDGWTEGIHLDDRERCIDIYRTAVAAQQGFRMEFRLRRADGEYRWLLDHGIPRFSPDEIFVGYIGSCIDITERKQFEAELRVAKEAAEAANEAKDKFLAVLSHELRTPLTPVMTALQILETEPNMPGDFGTLIETIRRNVELEARLIDDLLDQTRIARGKLQLTLETVDAHSLLENVIGICRSDIFAKQLQLVADLHAPHHHVRADSARLQQVFWNLIQNAIKFTPGGGTITIRTDNDQEDNLRVEVSDTGIGIDAAVIPRIFDAFEQGERTITRRYGGLGLGLAISKSLADLHGWTITASSPGPDQGSTFQVVMSTVPPESNTEPAAEGETTDSTQKRRNRILLVEDHIDTSKVMKLLLERRGYEVETAHSVAAGLESALTRDFDLLISDIGLPDGSGLDLMRELMAKRPLKGIALSGFGMEDDVRKSMEAGFAEHLVKPVNFKALQEAIERVLA